jgi:hypothetical protein
MKRYVGILLALVALPLVAAAVSVAVADPETGPDGAEIGSVMLLAGMTFGAFLADAAVLHRGFRIERNVGLVLLGITAVLVTVALRFVSRRTSDGSTCQPSSPASYSSLAPDSASARSHS